MAYIDKHTGEKKYTLKEKYNYYKKKANSANSKNKQGETIGFTGRVALANRANSIKRTMGKNKTRFDYYGNAICGPKR